MFKLSLPIKILYVFLVSLIALNTMFITLILMRDRETLKIFQGSIERARLYAGGLVVIHLVQGPAEKPDHF